MRVDGTRRRGLGRGTALLIAMLAGAKAYGQLALQQEIVAELQGMSHRAATVFVGQITTIEHRGNVVEVAFRVERPVQGYAGSTYVLREWGGAWLPGQSRYRVGQRALAFVHGNSAAGLSSPVHGAEGLVPVQVQGVNAPMLLDVRRVAASVVRSPGMPLPTPQESLLPLDDVLAAVYPGRLKLRAPLSEMRLAPGEGGAPVRVVPVQRGVGEGAALRSRDSAPLSSPRGPFGGSDGSR